jgi:transcriptional regulator
MYDGRDDHAGRKEACWSLVPFVALLIAIPAALAQVPVEERPASATQTAAPKLEVSTSLWDFGQKWAGEKAETTITLKNVGDAPLRIEKVKTSCGCTAASVKKKLLEPGESEDVKVTYDTNKAVETVSQKIHIHSNDPTSPVVTIEVKGQIRQVVKVSEKQGLNFGSLGRNDALTKSVEIECVYTEPLALRLKEIASESFDVRLEEIEAGHRYRLSATTKPPLQDGLNYANVELLTGLDLLPEVSVRVWGTVQAPITVIPNALYVSGQINEPTQRDLRVTSRRDRPLKVTGVTVSDPAIQVEVLPSSALPAKPSSENVVTVRVLLPPPGELPAGGATITIATDDDEYAELVVPVRTRAVAKKPSVADKSLKSKAEAGALRPRKEAKP